MSEYIKTLKVGLAICLNDLEIIVRLKGKYR